MFVNKAKGSLRSSRKILKYLCLAGIHLDFIFWILTCIVKMFDFQFGRGYIYHWGIMSFKTLLPSLNS